MSTARPLMLVSATADARLRAEVAEGLRPRPDFLVLEERHGVELLDWSRVPGPAGRGPVKIAAHVAAALRRARSHDVVLFADGEHLGIPLAAGLRALRAPNPLLVLGHHLTSRRKASLMRRLGVGRRMSRVLVHSEVQRRAAIDEAGVRPERVAVVPYQADPEFWRPQPGETDEDEEAEALVVTAGLEHRDYATLAAACEGLPVRVHAAVGSLHSPRATTAMPAAWPERFTHGFAGYVELRRLYARASVVAVPLLENDFQAGVTTILEAAAMGKAIVTTATKGRSDAVVDGETGILVPPGDAEALRDALRAVLADSSLRRRLGRAARDAFEARFSVDAYADTLARHLSELAAAGSVRPARGYALT